MIEVALLAPWLFFLFAGALDMGFYAYAMISVENAARVAVIHASSSSKYANDSGSACNYAISEMDGLPNINGLQSCSSLPLIVAATPGIGPDGAATSTVTITYQSMQLIPIPGLAGQITITRTAEMRMKDS